MEEKTFETGIINAKIDRTNLFIADGKLTYVLSFIIANENGDYVSGGGLRGQLNDASEMERLMTVIGCGEWESVTSAFVRIRFSSESGEILAIGNILADKWYEVENKAIEASEGEEVELKAEVSE